VAAWALVQVPLRVCRVHKTQPFLMLHNFCTRSGMNPIVKSLSALVCLVLICSGCNISPKTGRALSQQSGVAERTGVDSIAGTELASNEEIHKNFLNGGSDSDQQFVSDYYSASGKYCKRYQSMADTSTTVHCQSQKGEWQIAKRVEGLYPGETPALAAASSEQVQAAPDQGLKILSMSQALQSQDNVLDNVRTVGSDSADSVSAYYAIRVGETLWGFSQRVTGTGTNWETIAEANAIENPKHIASGTNLLVPAHLVAAE